MHAFIYLWEINLMSKSKGKLKIWALTLLQMKINLI